MKETIINKGKSYYFQDMQGNRSTITAKQATELFTGWKKQGLDVKRKYGMNNKIIWIWIEK